MTTKDYLADKSKIIDEEIKKLKDVSGTETLCTLSSAFVGALGIGFMFSSLFPLKINNLNNSCQKKKNPKFYFNMPLLILFLWNYFHLYPLCNKICQ